MVEQPVKYGAENHELRRTLGPIHLTAIGISAIIGAGIFVITGHAAASFAGPGVMFSFAIAGIGCLFTALCYAEFAAMIPVAGSAYTYSYAALGRHVAWFVGWNLVLEYMAAVALVSVGWSGYFCDFLHTFGIDLPVALSTAPIAVDGAQRLIMTGGFCNLPAVLLVWLMTAVLIGGVNLSANFNNVMVAIKLGIVILVIVIGLPHVNPANLTPFVPPNNGEFGHFGWSGVMRATGVIFYAYIGFDVVSVAAQEARNPQRDLPIGILASLFICTALYMAVSYVLTGLVSYKTLNVAHPVSFALEASPATAGFAVLVNIGAIFGLASVVLVMLLGQTRIFLAMAQDGLIPEFFARVHSRFRTPVGGTLVTGLIASLLAGVAPLDVLGELISIGVLAAFVVVCAGVMILRVTRPHSQRPFRTPFVWLVAPAGIAVCLLMMGYLPLNTWLRLLIWTLTGSAIYAFYGAKRVPTLARWQLP